MNDRTCVSVLNVSRAGELHTYNRERTYELYVRSQLVEVGVVLRDHQQTLFVDGHVCKLTTKINHMIFSICKNSLFGTSETGRGRASSVPVSEFLFPLLKIV